MTLPSEITHVIDDLMRGDLQFFRDRYFDWLLYSTYFVIAGIALEGPEIFFDIREVLAKPKPRRSTRNCIKVVASAGWLLIVLGVVGEAWFDSKVSDADTMIQGFNTSLLTEAQRESTGAEMYAGNAILFAGKASDSATRATRSAARAESLAKGARTEADSFEVDIKAAKQQSIDANIKLEAALKRVKEQELAIEKIKTGRSISSQYRDIMAEDLKRFSGIQFDASVGTNSECSDLLKTILRILSKAGWKQVPFNGPVNSGGFELAVGVNTANGIEITFDKRKESEFWQPAKRLAGLLESLGIAAAAGYTDDKAANTAVMHVIVGTKPIT